MVSVSEVAESFRDERNTAAKITVTKKSKAMMVFCRVLVLLITYLFKSGYTRVKEPNHTMQPVKLRYCDVFKANGRPYTKYGDNNLCPFNLCSLSKPGTMSGLVSVNTCTC